MNDDARASSEPQTAITRPSRWPGWIWAVPIAAVLIVGYLAVKEFLARGPEVAVVFPVAGNLQAGNTKVTYHGMEVGTVSAVALQHDLQHVLVHLSMHANMAGHLGPGTQFWIAGAQPSLSHPASLRAIISGPTIGIDPRPGSPHGRFVGLGQEPTETSYQHGTRFVLEAATLGSVSRGTALYYRDLQVGVVQSTTLEPGGRSFAIQAFIGAPFDGLVHTDTRFWDAGAAQLTMVNGGPRLQMHSVPALFEGAVAFETPDQGAPRAKSETHFPLFPSRDAATDAPGPGALDYRVVFPAPDGGVSEGGAVQLDGKRVGSVRRAALRYQPSSGRLQEEVTVALTPSRVDLPAGQSWQSDPRPQMDAMLRRLIAQGLRAEIGSSVPVVGGKIVTLAFVPGAAAAELGSGPVPLIPTGPSNDITGIMKSVAGVAAKVQALPLDQIAADLQRASAHIATLTASPALEQSVARLDATLANAEAM
ncbi:MAG: intermembrane transport protein PqiB, partial [Acetobacteraceae bacterium]